MEQRPSLCCLFVCLHRYSVCFYFFFLSRLTCYVFLFSPAFFSLALFFDAAYLPPFHLPLLLSVLVNGELQTQIPWTAVSDMMDNWAMTLSGEDVFARRQDVWDAANFLRSVPGHVHCICEVQLILKEYLDQRKATRKFMAVCVCLQHADLSPNLCRSSRWTV